MPADRDPFNPPPLDDDPAWIARRRRLAELFAVSAIRILEARQRDERKEATVGGASHPRGLR